MYVQTLLQITVHTEIPIPTVISRQLHIACFMSDGKHTIYTKRQISIRLRKRQYRTNELR